MCLKKCVPDVFDCNLKTRNGVNPDPTSHTGNFYSPGGVTSTDTVTHTDGEKLNA